MTGGSYPNYPGHRGCRPDRRREEQHPVQHSCERHGVSFAIGHRLRDLRQPLVGRNDLFVTPGGGLFKIGQGGSLAQGTGTELTLIGLAPPHRQGPRFHLRRPRSTTRPTYAPSPARRRGRGTPGKRHADILGVTRSADHAPHRRLRERRRRGGAGDPTRRWGTRPARNRTLTSA